MGKCETAQGQGKHKKCLKAFDFMGFSTSFKQNNPNWAQVFVYIFG
jgi:hypothetical protein